MGADRLPGDKTFGSGAGGSSRDLIAVTGGPVVFRRQPGIKEPSTAQNTDEEVSREPSVSEAAEPMAAAASADVQASEAINDGSRLSRWLAGACAMGSRILDRVMGPIEMSDQERR